MKHDVGGFGIEPEIEFVAGSVDEFGIGGLCIQARSHEDQFFGEAWELRVDGDGKREVSHGAAGVDRHLIGKLADHADEEVCGVFVGGPGGGLAFWHLSELVGRMIEL